ncbi:hypothetical protein WJX84_003756 [Apatococcus fuscideae]|uniref:Uncharacterized protein n=1 Tax=Apatococcus fuscideae TaxID=2026836 RepID=A0AAW1TEI4_9CHLO
MLFKGVNQALAIYQLTNALLWHEVRQTPTSRKVVFLSAGRGLAATLVTHVMSHHNSPIPEEVPPPDGLISAHHSQSPDDICSRPGTSAEGLGLVPEGRDPGQLGPHTTGVNDGVGSASSSSGELP